ncbi:hypothetical protein ScPMuIL_009745 [Solemya velum]
MSTSGVSAGWTGYMSLAWSLLSVAFATFIIAKVSLAVYQYRKWRKVYDKCPGETDNHWFYGEIKKFPTDCESRLKFQYKKVCRYPRFYRTWIGPIVPNILVHHPDTVKILLKTSEPKPRGYGGTYEYAIPWLGEGLLLSGGARWARARRLLTPAFHFDILRQYLKIYNDSCNILMNKIDGAIRTSTSFELFNPVSLCTLDIILRCAFSYDNDCQIRGEVHPYVNAVNELSEMWLERARTPWLHPDVIFKRTDLGRRFQTHCEYVHSVSEDIINRRRATIPDDPAKNIRYLDFLDILLTAKDDTGAGLTTEEIRNEVDTFLFEGHDTTSSALSWILYSLADNPQFQDRVQCELDEVLGDRDEIEWSDLPKMEYLTMCIKEGMRLHSPVPFVQRQGTKPVQMDDILFPAGTTFTIHIYNLHHNPEIWDRPFQYTPDRFSTENSHKRDSYAFCPFSAGPRNCIGQNFAMNEEKVILAKILKKYKIHLDPKHTVRHKLAGVMRAENGIRIVASLR